MQKSDLIVTKRQFTPDHEHRTSELTLTWTFGPKLESRWDKQIYQKNSVILYVEVSEFLNL